MKEAGNHTEGTTRCDGGSTDVSLCVPVAHCRSPFPLAHSSAAAHTAMTAAAVVTAAAATATNAATAAAAATASSSADVGVVSSVMREVADFFSLHHIGRLDQHYIQSFTFQQGSRATMHEQGSVGNAVRATTRRIELSPQLAAAALVPLLCHRRRHPAVVRVGCCAVRAAVLRDHQTAAAMGAVARKTV